MADWDLEGWFAGLCMVCDRSAKKEVIPRVVSSLLDRRDCPGGSVVSPIPILRRSSTSSPTPANTSPHAPFMPSKDDTPKHVMLMLVRMNATELAEEGDFLAMHLKTLQSEGNPFSEKDHAIQLRIRAMLRFIRSRHKKLLAADRAPVLSPDVRPWEDTTPSPTSPTSPNDPPPDAARHKSMVACMAPPVQLVSTIQRATSISRHASAKSLSSEASTTPPGSSDVGLLRRQSSILRPR